MIVAELNVSEHVLFRDIGIYESEACQLKWAKVVAVVSNFIVTGEWDGYR